jgi:predicted type IV restriction endonuclease
MEIAERAQALPLNIWKYKTSIETEEVTKNTFAIPFISTALGFDVFNPSEFIPEFTVDVGAKKAERADYAIAHNGQA